MTKADARVSANPKDGGAGVEGDAISVVGLPRPQGSAATEGRPPGCAALSRAAGEPRYGTAMTAPGVLLVEQPGPWGRGGLVECDLDTELATELADRAKQEGVPVLLIRRGPGRYRPDPPIVLAVHTGRGGPWMERVAVPDQRMLLDIDLRALRSPEPLGLGEPVTDPQFVVCTHGRKDPCCAEHGRPLVRALRGLDVDVWECSHVGGDRFAANMGWFPEGIFYGRVEPDDAPVVLASAAAGHIDLAHYRGRCADDPVVQAADFLVRERLGLTALEGLVPLDVVELPVEGAGALDGSVDGYGPASVATVAVTFDSHAGEVVAELVPVDRPARLTTCSAIEPWSPRSYELVNLRVAR